MKSLALKRAFDLAASSIGLLLLSPLLLALAVWIRLDSPGPVFFRQERIGLRGRPFRIYKFRSMRVDHSGPQITVGADDRITRSGHIIRAYKLDELPQLLNVFLGDMSLVGPRPEVPRYVALYPADVRAEVLDDHVMTVLVRTTVGVLTAIAVAILVAGVATQNAFGIVGGGLATIMLTTALICMSSVPEKLFNR